MLFIGEETNQLKTKVKKEFSILEKKFYSLRFSPDTEAHIKVNTDVCRLCEGKECTKFCPSQVFTWSELDDTLIVAYENCLECGACKIGCPYENIQYRHPDAGYGYIK